MHVGHGDEGAGGNDTGVDPLTRKRKRTRTKGKKKGKRKKKKKGGESLLKVSLPRTYQCDRFVNPERNGVSE